MKWFLVLLTTLLSIFVTTANAGDMVNEDWLMFAGTEHQEAKTHNSTADQPAFWLLTAVNVSIEGNNIPKLKCSPKRACLSLEECMAVSRKLKTGECQYKFTNLPLKFHQGFATDVAVRRRIQNSVVEWRDCDINARTIHAELTGSFKLCAEVCLRIPKCRTFTWDVGSDDAMCRIKEVVTACTNKSGVRTGVRFFRQKV